MSDGIAGKPRRVAVLTSGGDAPGMNPALRAVVRTAIDAGLEVFAVREGFRGLVLGGDSFRQMSWESVGGILHRGGTFIGTARSPEFQTVEGRQRAVRSLLGHNISRLIIIGGDGSLNAANILRSEWSDHLQALVEEGMVRREVADRHAYLAMAGLVGSIDNDMTGTDMTIGADTALHRIAEAIDAIGSTASSHQRTFVVEVMGRRCGYLAVMSALATGSDWVLIPEKPPRDGWEQVLCDRLSAGRSAGRRDSIVIVAEGAVDQHGNPITSSYVQEMLEKHLEEEVRLTILGHVQRGGAPTAYDRYMSTLIGHAAVGEVLHAGPDQPPQVIGMRNNRITRTPLSECVEQTRAMSEAVDNCDYERAMQVRGGSFAETLKTLRTLLRVQPNPPKPDQKSLRLAVLNAGGPAPGMNTATRAAVRLALDRGHVVLGVRNGFQGLIDGDVAELGWMDVSGWVAMGGSELGTNRKVPDGGELYAIARCLEEHSVDGMLVIGGWSGYLAAYRMLSKRSDYPSFDIPIVCLPASINNNLPGAEVCVGADTALNSIVEAVDKIKQSAVASSRCFVVEVMGRYCGFLALMSGIATGAERVYLNEEGITLDDLQADVRHLIGGFRSGKRLGLMIRNENANPVYTTPFMVSLFSEESQGLFEVRQAILGHLQQGGSPTPFDRIQATKLATHGVETLMEAAEHNRVDVISIGVKEGQLRPFDLQDLARVVDMDHQRPRNQWWMELRPIARILAQPGPAVTSE